MRKVNARCLLGLVACAVTLLSGYFTSSAVAGTPGFGVVGRTVPTYLPPGGEGVLKLYVYNLGSGESGQATLTDVLPAGLVATRVESLEGEVYVGCEGSQTIACELGSIQPGRQAVIAMRVSVEAGRSGTVSQEVTVGGGGALNELHASLPVTISAESSGPGINNLTVFATNPDGTPDTQAGSHPGSLVVAFGFNVRLREKFQKGPGLPIGFSPEEAIGGQPRNLNVALPPGLVGDPQAVPQCPRALLDASFGGGACPPDTRVGEQRATIIHGKELLASEPIYNMVPPPGVAAQFAFMENGIPVFIDSGVRTGTDNAIVSHVDNIPQRQITYVTTEIWGVPAEHIEGLSAKPLLTLPTSCAGPLQFSAELLSLWDQESLDLAPTMAVTHNDNGEPVGVNGCESLQPFKPSIAITPDTTYADTPAGLSVDVKMPQGLNPEGLQTPGLKNTTVVLPEGVVINPGQATGLQACPPSKEALGKLPDGEVNEQVPSCPAASKVGTDEVRTPLVRDKLKGSIYILENNPPNLQLLVTASGDGVNLKLVGNVHLNETTGQLTTTFENTPDVPFEDFKLAFSGGAQAALATPTRCGTYESTADFTPWSTPYIGNQLESSRFRIESGSNGSPCVWPMPFSPTLSAGSTTDQAGGYTGFTMLLQREDEQQRIGTLQFKTPPGLLGMISHVQLCEEAQAASGNCPAGSQIGHTVATSGPGPYPFEVPQAGGPPAPIYITGPYDGAPYGLSIVVPVVAGPFNLGTVVVRAKIEVDPRTSQLTITTTNLPRILDGIPTDIRQVDAVIDRSRFMFNPTDCNEAAFTGTATSLEGAAAPLSSRFQVGSCRELKFKPAFTASTNGRTSRVNGASLKVKIAFPPGNAESGQASGYSNIRQVKVDLPKQLPSQLKTLQHACPHQVFEADPAGCSAASRVGHAVVHTQVLPAALEGPAYFVSYGGEEFPKLIMVLQGDGVTVDIEGNTYIRQSGKSHGVTSSTFRSVPDVPFETFELTLPQGSYSALAANTNLCKITRTVLVKKRVRVRSHGHSRALTRKVREAVRGSLLMPTTFVAQNGTVIHQSTPIAVTGCSKAR